MSDLLTFSPPGALDTGTKSFAGAKATFFNAGTTTPRTVYTDQAETIPAASPLVADAAGLWPEIFASGGAVKVVVTYSDDTTGYTLDPCTKVAAAGAGAASVSFTPSILRPYDNVQEAIDSGTFPARTITGTAGLVTVTNGNGAAGDPTLTIANGTNGQVLRAGATVPAWGAQINLGTAVASTSGTAIDFTGIPSWARRVTVMLDEISTNGTSPIVLLVGNGSIVVSGYSSRFDNFNSTVATQTGTTGFGLFDDVVASATQTAVAVLSLISGNTWLLHGTGGSSAPSVGVFSGRIALAGALDRVRITTSGGVNTFDAGSINIAWE